MLTTFQLITLDYWENVYNMVRFSLVVLFIFVTFVFIWPKQILVQCFHVFHFFLVSFLCIGFILLRTLDNNIFYYSRFFRFVLSNQFDACCRRNELRRGSRGNDDGNYILNIS